MNTPRHPHTRRLFQGVTRRWVHLATLILTIVVCGVVASRPVTHATTIELTPVADTFVNESAERKNFGEREVLKVGNSPEKIAYLTFDLSPLDGQTVSSALLELEVANASDSDGTIHLVDAAAWNEASTTFNERIEPGEPVAALPSANVRAGETIQVDLTALVSERAGDRLSIALSHPGENTLRLVSREGEAGAPVLVVGYAGASEIAAGSTEIPAEATTTREVAATATATLYLPTVVNVHPKPATMFGAFPGAQGHGAVETIGGRGGRVIYVTNLADSGPGSLRAALEARGPRVVLFQVAGTITLQDDIDIRHPFVTIAGQTAPGEGVQIRGGMILIKTHDVIMRYLRIRAGDEANQSNPGDRDSLTMTGTRDDQVYNVVIDHCTLIWGPDIGGPAILQDAHHITIQNSIIGEGLYLSNHPEASASQGGHSLGLNITQLDPSRYGEGYPRYITLHHNLITTSEHRMPQVQGGEYVDVVNNVIYNWGNKAAHGNPRKLNLIGNYFLPGPETTRMVGWYPDTNALLDTLFPNAVYESGNHFQGNGTIRGTPNSVYNGSRFEPYSMAQTQSAQEAYQHVLADVGATRPVRDSVDARIVNNVITRQGNFLNGVGSPGLRIAWPALAGGQPAVDSDNDGMPDNWESQHFGHTSRGGTSDTSSDYDRDGFTDLEEYLNATDPTRP